MGNIAPEDFISLIKLAAQELRRLDGELAYQKQLSDALAIVEPLENRGIHFKGASRVDKAKDLVQRKDFDKLALLAKELPSSFGGLGKVGSTENPEAMDPFTRFVLTGKMD